VVDAVLRGDTSVPARQRAASRATIAAPVPRLAR